MGFRTGFTVVFANKVTQEYKSPASFDIRPSGVLEIYDENGNVDDYFSAAAWLHVNIVRD